MSSFTGSPANADLLTALGLDPMKVTGEALDVEVHSPDMVVIHYRGFITVTAEEYAAALLATRPSASTEGGSE